MIWIEADGRLVENEKIRLVQERVRQTDPLAIPFGQGTDQFPFDLLETAKFLYIANTLRHAAVWNPFKPRTIVKVFRHSHVVIERDVFGHVAEVRPCLKRLLKDIEPRDGRAARSSWHKAGQNAHRGRFAGAVRSQKSHDFALANFEVQILDRRLTGVTFRQIFDFNHCAIFP